MKISGRVDENFARFCCVKMVVFTSVFNLNFDRFLCAEIAVKRCKFVPIL